MTIEASIRRHFRDDEIDAFRRHGFIAVGGLFDAEAMHDLSAWTDEIQGAPESPGKHMAYYEDSLLEPERRVLSRVENLCPYHQDLDALVNGPELLGRASELFDEPAVLFKEKINFKMPGGNGFPAHQDVQAGWDAYASLFITALVAIDPATLENGCLEIAAGHHKRGLIGDHWRPLTDEELKDIQFVACLAQPGDAVFFDSFTPHGSRPNMTATSRRALYVTYNRRSEGDHRTRYYADKRKSYPPDCEREPGKKYVFRV